MEIWFIRHGESLANAGGKTENASDIPLTPAGREQGKRIAGIFEQAPDLIVVSPYLRTQETALPTVDRFPAANREVWDIQEFSYLDNQNYKNTTQEERRPFATAYWSKADPHFSDGQNAESFMSLIQRIHTMIDKLKACPYERVAVFSHGLFMHTLETMMTKPHLTPVEMMAEINDIRLNRHMPNAHIIKGKIENGNFSLVNNPPPAPKVPKWPKQAPR